MADAPAESPPSRTPEGAAADDVQPAAVPRAAPAAPLRKTSGSESGQKARNALRFNGPDMAAILAAAIAVFTLGAVQLWVELDESGGAKEAVHGIGKAWMPHADHIGPYSGKETLMVVVWLASWALLYLTLRHRHVDPRPWFAVALTLILAGVLLVWPPTWHFLGA